MTSNKLAMLTAFVVLAFPYSACTPTRPPKTPEGMLTYRLEQGLKDCGEVCPVGHPLAYDPTLSGTPVTQCCVDPFGITWSLCMWNQAGQYATMDQLMRSYRLDRSCGGDGYPDCKP